MGDDALVRAIHSSFHKALKKYGGAKFFDISSAEFNDDADPIENFIPLGSFFKLRFFLKLIRALYESDFVICGGGDLINGTVSYLGVIAIAKILGVPVVLLSVGADMRSASKVQRLYSRLIIPFVDAVILREEGSAEEFAKLRVPAKKIFKAADIALVLDDAGIKQAKNILKNEQINSSRDHIGISIRTPEDRRLIWGEKEYLCIAELCDYITESFGVDIIFVPMLNNKRWHFSSFSKFDSSYSDEKISDLIIDKIINKKNVHVIRGNYTASEIQSLFGSMKIVLGMRLHSLILSLNAGSPFVAINYSPKSDRFTNLLDIPGITISAHALNFDMLKQKVDYVWERRDDLRMLLKEKHGELKNRALRNTEIALQFMRKKNIFQFWIFIIPAFLFNFFIHIPTYLIANSSITIFPPFMETCKPKRCQNG